MYYAENEDRQGHRSSAGRDQRRCPGFREELLVKVDHLVTIPSWSHRAGTDCHVR